MVAKSYPISTSEDEFLRLKMQANLYHDDAVAMFDRIDVQAGWRCLDICCGIGDIACMLAERVGAGGSVLGADFDPAKLSFARDRAAERKLRNLSFVKADAFASGLPTGAFDLVHCRFALSVIPNGLGILDHMLELVRPVGVVCVEEVDSQTMRCLPDTADWQQGLALMFAAFNKNGANIDLGPELYGIFRDRGLDQIDIRPCLHALTADDPMTMHVPSTLAAMRDNILSFDLSNGEELDALIDRLYSHLAKPETMTISVNMMQVVGRAPG